MAYVVSILYGWIKDQEERFTNYLPFQVHFENIKIFIVDVTDISGLKSVQQNFRF